MVGRGAWPRLPKSYVLPKGLQVRPPVRQVEKDMEGQSQVPAEPAVLPEVGNRIGSERDGKVGQVNAPPVEAADAESLPGQAESPGGFRCQNESSGRGRGSQQAQDDALALE